MRGVCEYEGVKVRMRVTVSVGCGGKGEYEVECEGMRVHDCKCGVCECKGTRV